MRGLTFVVVASFLCLTSCQTVTKNALEISIVEANINGVKYRNQIVKVCGFATNEFENFKLTEKTAAHWSDRGVVLGVEWLNKEPKTIGPENRCITGKLVPRGGWASYERYFPDRPSDIFIGGGMTGADWVIFQTILSRD